MNKLLQKLKWPILTLVLAAGFVGFVLPVMPASAAEICTSQGLAPMASDSRVCCPPGSQGSAQACVFAKYINPTIKFLSAAAAVAAIIGITMGGIQYAASAGDPQKTSQGKMKIIRSIYGLAAFLFLYAGLQFLSPGGISANTGPPCDHPFLGLKPWFAYLPSSSFDSSCNIVNFSLFGSGNTPSQILPIVLVIADDLVRIAGLVAVAYVIVGGVQYVISQGEPDKTKRAKDTIVNALIGLAVAIIAASVVSYIGNRLS